MRDFKINHNRSLYIVTNKVSGEEYVLQGYVACDNYLIPFVPHWKSREQNSVSETWYKYWEPHYAERETWIPMSEVNFDEWDITEDWYKEYLIDAYESYKKILTKYHASF